MCEGKNVYIYTYIHIWAHTRSQTWYTQKRCDKRIITQYICHSEYNKQLQYANICTYGQKKSTYDCMGVHICEVCVGRQFCWESSQRFAIPEDVDAINEDDYWNLRTVGRVPSQQDIYPLKLISLRRPKVRIRRKQMSLNVQEQALIRFPAVVDAIMYYDCDKIQYGSLKIPSLRPVIFVSS